MRSSLLLLLAPLFLVAACSASEDVPGDQGDLGSTTSLSKKGCSASRADILASAGSTRGAAISRGFAWLDANVPYSQTGAHGGYRTDCSGFVSMCWSLKESFTTADFIGGSGSNTLLGSYDDLQPGDGFVRRQGKNGHAMLFLGWEDDAHTNACILEEADTALDMQFGPRSTASIKSQGFKAMRAKGMPDAAPTAAATTTTTTGDDDDDTTAPTTTTTTTTAPATVPVPVPKPAPVVPAVLPKAGDACNSDQICNPGNISGSGLICNRSSGTCEAGCKFDSGCPGTQLCKANKCI